MGKKSNFLKKYSNTKSFPNFVELNKNNYVFFLYLLIVYIFNKIGFSFYPFYRPIIRIRYIKY